MKKLIAGNWKMNGSRASSLSLVEEIATGLEHKPSLHDGSDFLCSVPYVYIDLVKKAAAQTGAKISVGAQDCALTEEGAYTGDVSAKMLADIGAEYVILGHSERRQYHNETDKNVSVKAGLAHAAGLKAIICVGETEAQREAGEQNNIVGQQLNDALPETVNPENTVIAYEPVWAIGTGKTATPEDVASMHKFIREKLKETVAGYDQIRILYGGSMKPANAKELLATENVDGGLIGGASLKAEDFLGIASEAIA